MGTDGGTRRPRADFERNRSEILVQADRHFAADGAGASLEAVARDAGVGSATLYRHFPTRDALLAEVLERRASQIAADGADYRDGDRRADAPNRVPRARTRGAPAEPVEMSEQLELVEDGSAQPPGRWVEMDCERRSAPHVPESCL